MLKGELLKSIRELCRNNETYTNLLCSFMEKMNVSNLKEISYEELKELYINLIYKGRNKS